MPPQLKFPHNANKFAPNLTLQSLGTLINNKFSNLQKSMNTVNSIYTLNYRPATGGAILPIKTMTASEFRSLFNNNREILVYITNNIGPIPYKLAKYVKSSVNSIKGAIYPVGTYPSSNLDEYTNPNGWYVTIVSSVDSDLSNITENVTLTFQIQLDGVNVITNPVTITPDI